MHPPLIAHVIHHLYIGGLENGLVNLINRLPEERFRHAIICIKDYSDFYKRIQRQDVPIFALHKPDGQQPKIYFQLYQLFRKLKPSIVHSRNLSGLDSLLPAMMAGVPYRIHGEHGRDVDDLEGTNRKYQWLRKLHKPFINQYVPLSKDLESYLVDKIYVRPRKIKQIYNGVDTDKFYPVDQRQPLPIQDFVSKDDIIIGTVGRFQAVKDQMNLANAFIMLNASRPELRGKLKLAIIGDGVLLDDVKHRLNEAGLDDSVWLPGARDDAAQLLRCFDIFVQPSLAEGISNTILEAMSTGLPIVATDVGGNPELVDREETGLLVPPADPESLSRAIGVYVDSKDMRLSAGRSARQRVEQRFSIDAMVDQYLALYNSAIN